MALSRETSGAADSERQHSPADLCASFDFRCYRVPKLNLDGRTTMFEYDEDGKEWFGYTFSSEESDHAAVVSVFLGNVQYLEWFFRHIKNAPKKLTLAEQLNYLFDLLPDGGP